MENSRHKLIQVAYDLYVCEDSEEKMVERAPREHPFQFISGMGETLDAFEAHISPLETGISFDFIIPKNEAYGDFDPAHVIDVKKEMFCIDGHFDKETIFVGNVVPLVNEDGNHFYATVLDITKDQVKLDLNPPFAGKDLHFKGSIVESHEASEEEVQGLLNRMSGGCCCDHCGGDCGESHCEDTSHAHGDGGCGCGHCH